MKLSGDGAIMLSTALLLFLSIFILKELCLQEIISLKRSTALIVAVVCFGFGIHFCL